MIKQLKKHAYLALLLPSLLISVSIVVIPGIQTGKGQHYDIQQR